MTFEIIQAAILAFLIVAGFLVMMRILWRQFRGPYKTVREAVIQRLIALLQTAPSKGFALKQVETQVNLADPHPGLEEVSTRFKELGIKTA